MEKGLVPLDEKLRNILRIGFWEILGCEEDLATLL
jgi:hypothetical protein